VSIAGQRDEAFLADLAGTADGLAAVTPRADRGCLFEKHAPIVSSGACANERIYQANASPLLIAKEV
jgi:hypothetical protein